MKIFAFIVLCVFQISYAQSNSETNQKGTQGKDPMRAHMESRNVFLNSMADPLVAEIFRQDQLSKFSTPFDHEIRMYFSSHPVFGQIFHLIRQNYSVILNEFSNSMLIGSTQIERGLTPDYDRIRKIVQETALDLGFSEKAIHNIELYVISGTENAFTVSGLQDRIVIVFQRDIFRTMSNGEIRAVIGHELGHIRAEHVITGQVNEMLLQLLGIYIMKSADGLTPMEAQEQINRSRSFIEHKIFDGGQAAISGMLDAKYHTGRSRGGSSPKYMDAQKRQFVEQMNRFMMQFLNQPQQIQRQFFVEYLDILIRNLENTGALSESVEFFRSVQKDMAESPYFRLANEDVVRFNLAVASFSISQAFETTSDMISNSVVKREFLASAMAKLLGADFDGSSARGYESRSERQRIIDQLLSQAKKFHEINKGDSAAQFLSLMTHPAPVIRVEQIMSLDKYPAIIFADPFMRTLYLRDLLSGQLVDLTIKARGIAAYVKQFKDAGQPIPKQVEQLRLQIGSALKRLAPQFEQLSQNIINMILNEAKGGLTAPFNVREEVVMLPNGFIELETKTSGKAPRFEAFTRYLGNFRKELMARMNELNQKAEGAPPEVAQVLQYNSAVLMSQFKISQAFVDEIVKQALEKVKTMNISVESQNAISAMILLLEKVGTMKSTAELLKTLGEMESSIQSSKRFVSPEETEVRLFTNFQFPLVLPRASLSITCRSYFK